MFLLFFTLAVVTISLSRASQHWAHSRYAFSPLHSLRLFKFVVTVCKLCMWSYKYPKAILLHEKAQHKEKLWKLCFQPAYAMKKLSRLGDAFINGFPPSQTKVEVTCGIAIDSERGNRNHMHTFHRKTVRSEMLSIKGFSFTADRLI